MFFLLTGRWAFYWGAYSWGGLLTGGPYSWGGAFNWGAYNRGGLITGELITEGAHNWGRL